MYNKEENEQCIYQDITDNTSIREPGQLNYSGAKPPTIRVVTQSIFENTEKYRNHKKVFQQSSKVFFFQQSSKVFFFSHHQKWVIHAVHLGQAHRCFQCVTSANKNTQMNAFGKARKLGLFSIVSDSESGGHDYHIFVFIFCASLAFFSNRLQA